MKVRFSISFLLLSFCSWAQSPSVSPHVINSAAGSGSNGTVNVVYSIGEPIVTTGGTGSTLYTQGFLQPDYSGTFGVLTVNAIATNISCAGQVDGSITLNVSGGHGNIGYVWNNTTADTAIQTGLGPGNYSVTIIDSLPGGGTVIYNNAPLQFIIADATEPCPVTIHSAFSPNGDGKNDLFIIDGIENFPDNTVSIFNRWGTLIWSAQNYDNLTKVWDGKDQRGADLTEGTYYYIIDVKKGKIRKSWIELTR